MKTCYAIFIVVKVLALSATFSLSFCKIEIASPTLYGVHEDQIWFQQTVPDTQ